jgi:hypothetical protein
MKGNELPYTHFHRAAVDEGRLLPFLTGQSLSPAKNWHIGILQLEGCCWPQTGLASAWPMSERDNSRGHKNITLAAPRAPDPERKRRNQA